MPLNPMPWLPLTRQDSPSVWSRAWASVNFRAFIMSRHRSGATILALEKVKGLGPVKFRKIYEQLGSISPILDLSDDEIARTLKFPDKYVFKIDLSLVDDFERETLSERCEQSELRHRRARPSHRARFQPARARRPASRGGRLARVRRRQKEHRSPGSHPVVNAQGRLAAARAVPASSARRRSVRSSSASFR